ncbi:hypothetical protein CBR_g37097 [Chara braunii]|uniref:Protein kinase domain-containing protein n=1 Tax=Chara braunii TaxID=69332 RepID=A0A388LMC3_CHABU|nr:hypothetical protein CBR_g37097 [Chara braunii]|eukprot:GBG83383.1 hypothetical protein CBR_g37097 [Chara braunii]
MMAGQDAQKGQELSELKLKVQQGDNMPANWCSFDVHPSEPWIVGSSPNGEGYNFGVWNYEDGQHVKGKFSEYENTARFLGQENRFVAVVGKNLQLILYEILTTSGNRMREIKEVRELMTLTGEKIWDVHSTGQCVLLVGHLRDSCIWGVAFTGGRGKNDKEGSSHEIHFWDLDHDLHRMKKLWETRQRYCSNLHSLDPHIFATGVWEGDIQIWDAEAMAVFKTFKADSRLHNIQFCTRPQKPLIITSHGSGKVQIWDYQRKECLITLDAHEDSLWKAFFHPELPYVLTVSGDWRDRSIKAWRDSDYQLEKRFSIDMTGWFTIIHLFRNGSLLLVKNMQKLNFITIEGVCPKLELKDVERIKQPETRLSTWRQERGALEEGLKKQIQTHVQRIKELEAEVNTVRMERQALGEKFEGFLLEHEREKALHSKRVKQLETELSTERVERRALKERFERETQAHAQRIKEFETEVSNVRMERQALGERFERFRSEHEMEKGIHSKEVKLLENEIGNLLSEREALKERFEKSKLEIRDLECRLEKERGAGEGVERSDGVTIGVPEVDMHPFREFSGDELKTATNDFSDSCKLEERHYGCVYVGRITPVVVKRLEVANGMTQDKHAQVTRELVERLKSLPHPHLQNLLGVCYGESCLVYEYMANGNLKDWISPSRRSQQGFLPWYIRLRIMAQVAQALSFLHCNQSLRGGPIVHCAIKPENIFLDHSFVAKIAEVDMALLGPVLTEGGESSEGHRFPGTDAKYMAPEFFQTEVFTQKTDIYALGIAILEMLTGKFRNALGIMEDAVEDAATFQSTLDPNAGSWDVDLAMEAAQVGLRCANPNRRLRPSMMTGEGAILPALESIAQKVELADSIEDIRRMSFCE